MIGRRGVLIVFAKEPRAGAVKTRLTPPLAADLASRFYACMLADVLESAVVSAHAFGLDPVLAVHPAGAVPALARQAPPPFRVVAQRGTGLAQRMDWAVREAAAAGSRPILLRGSDSPALGREQIVEAVRALETHDLALGPDRDGGYNLVGLRAPAPGLFEHPMSTERVLDDTLANARRAGLRAQRLATGFDLDRIEDLRWLAEARASGAAVECPRTLAFADRHGLWCHVR